MALGLKVCTAFAKHLSSVPTTYVRYVITAYKSSFRGLSASGFCMNLSPDAHRYMHTHTLAHI